MTKLANKGRGKPAVGGPVGKVKKRAPVIRRPACVMRETIKKQPQAAGPSVAGQGSAKPAIGGRPSKKLSIERFVFRRKKFSVVKGKVDEAKREVLKAWYELDEEEWAEKTESEWNKKVEDLIQKYRVGISHGGFSRCHLNAKRYKKGRLFAGARKYSDKAAEGSDKAAEGAGRPAGNKKGEGKAITPPQLKEGGPETKIGAREDSDKAAAGAGRPAGKGKAITHSQLKEGSLEKRIGEEKRGEEPLRKKRISAKFSPSLALLDVGITEQSELKSFHNRLQLLRAIKFLGSGTFGRVFEISAVGDTGPLQVAVKVVAKLVAIGHAKDACCDPAAAREIAILAKLSGTQGVVQLLSWCESHFDVQLVFPIFPHTIASFISSQGNKKLPAELLPRIARQLLDALNQVHKAKVVHGDLKPGNILLLYTSAIGDITVVIGDFGSAITLDVGPGSPTSFTNGKLVGQCNTTYQYRAPELFVTRRLRAISYSADVWAMGCVIVYWDTYKHAFGKEKMQQAEIAVVLDSALQTLYGHRASIFDGKRDDTTLFFNTLAKLQLKDEKKLPWAKEQPLAFRNTIRSFFVADPLKRPLASDLAADKGLLEACNVANPLKRPLASSLAADKGLLEACK